MDCSRNRASRVWGCMPRTPPSQEAEAGGAHFQREEVEGLACLYEALGLSLTE